MKKYDIIYSDPPWQYSDTTFSGGEGRKPGIPVSYDTMSIAEMKEMSIPAADDSLMFMWVTNPFLKHGIELLESWGYEYSTVAFWWRKRTIKGNDHTLMGRWTLGGTEACILGKRGVPTRLGPKVRNVRQVIEDAPFGCIDHLFDDQSDHLLTDPVMGHSRKPLEAIRRIERMFPTATKLEMFCRNPQPGWDVFGNDHSVEGLSIEIDRA